MGNSRSKTPPFPQKLLLEWYDRMKRSLPWRDTSDPYAIWISEIMLQQTRVGQVQPYFERFMDQFPDVQALAASHLDQLLRCWEGLGYYTRARNLHKSAREITGRFGGKLPDSFKELTSLPGIGPYTASAILSIAFQKPFAVVDGNVVRVICRLMALDGDTRKRSIQKQIESQAQVFLDPSRPGDFNQAMMELGATVCTPRNPACEVCPLQNYCQARKMDQVSRYPWKSPSSRRPHLNIAVGVIINERGEVLIARRPEQSMLGGLWEFPGGKQEAGECLRETANREIFEELGIRVSVEEEPLTIIRHAYSHFSITMHAYFATIEEGIPRNKNGESLRWVALPHLREYAFPKANRRLTDILVEYKSSETTQKVSLKQQN